MSFDKIKIAASVAAIASFGAATDAGAVNLRIGDSFPPSHIAVRVITKPWMEEVTRLSNGEVTFNYFPAEQAGKAKDMLTLTQSGVLDIGYIGPAYVSDKMPLSAAAELPGEYSTSCDASLTYWKLSQPGGYFYENEFKKNGVRPLIVALFPAYQLNVREGKSINKLADFAGLKVRAGGGGQELLISKLGAVAVKMAPPDIYEALSRKTIDGTLLAYISLDSYKLTELVGSSTTNANFGGVAVTYSINLKKFNALSENVQNALVEAGDTITRAACAEFDRQEKETYESLKERGVEFFTMEGEDLEKYNSLAQEVNDEWAARMDARRLDGSGAVRAFHDARTELRNEAK